MATVTREQKAIAAWTQAMATAENYAIDPHRHIALLVQAGEQMAALLTPGSAATSPPATVTLEQLQSIEWNGWNRDEADTCPACGRDKRRGHNDVCFIAAALASAPPAAPPEDAPSDGISGLYGYDPRQPYRPLPCQHCRTTHNPWAECPAASAAPPDPPGLDPGQRAQLLERASKSICGSRITGFPKTCREGGYGVGSWCDACQLHALVELLAARQSDPPGLKEKAEPYCRECGSTRLKYLETYANGEEYRCMDCGHEAMQ